jgi:hypothetical protein
MHHLRLPVRPFRFAKKEPETQKGMEGVKSALRCEDGKLLGKGSVDERYTEDY